MIMGLVASFSGQIVTVAAEDESMGLLVVVVGIIMVITGIVSLIEGIFSVRAAKDNSKIGPAWWFAIISLVMGVISIGSNLANGSGIAGSIPSLLISILIFVAANTIKKAVKNPSNAA
ncbi:MAG: hypothetical protein K6C95_06960 [Lachnospiraceae bacterium]|nr:hypothetical protein [Lachnospiraceae bacterium]